MAIPKVSTPKVKAPDVNLPRGHDIGKLYSSKKKTTPNLEGQGMVDVDRIQMMMEAMRSNPNGVRVQFLMMPEESQARLLQQLGEKFPPARPDQLISPEGQEILQFLTQGEGVAASPERMKVLADDYVQAMADGPVTLNRQPVGNIDPDSGARDGIDMSTELGPAEEGGVIDNARPENPQNPNAANRDNAALGLGWKTKQDRAKNFRGMDREVGLLPDGQPINTPVEGTGRPSTSAAREMKGEDFAARQIENNTSQAEADLITAGDEKSYQDTLNEQIVGLLNNSRNPNSLGGSRIERIYELAAGEANAVKDPRLQFASVDDFVDALAGHVDVKSLNTMKNPSRIGEELAPSIKAGINLEEVKDILRRQAIQRYGGSGWGAESAEALSNPATGMDTGSEVNTNLDNLDDAGSIELEDIPQENLKKATQSESDIPPEDFRDDGQFGPGIRDAKKANVENNAREMERIADEVVDELIEEGASPQEIQETLENIGLDAESIAMARQHQIEMIDRFGMPKQGGSNPLGSQVQARNGRGDKANQNTRNSQKKADGTPVNSEQKKAMDKIVEQNPADESEAINKRANIKGESNKPEPSKGDLQSSGGAEKLDPVESSNTQLPEESDSLTYTSPKKKKADSSSSKPDSQLPEESDPLTYKSKEGDTGSKKKKDKTETQQNKDKTEDGNGKGGVGGYVKKHPIKTGLAALIGIGTASVIANRKGDKHVVSDPTKPHGGLGGEVGVSDRGRNGLNVDVDGGKKGKLTDAERTALLRQLMNKPRLNRNTQTNKNWVR